MKTIKIQINQSCNVKRFAHKSSEARELSTGTYNINSRGTVWTRWMLMNLLYGNQKKRLPSLSYSTKSMKQDFRNKRIQWSTQHPVSLHTWIWQNDNTQIWIQIYVRIVNRDSNYVRKYWRILSYHKKKYVTKYVQNT